MTWRDRVALYVRMFRAKPRNPFTLLKIVRWAQWRKARDGTVYWYWRYWP